MGEWTEYDILIWRYGDTTSIDIDIIIDTCRYAKVNIMPSKVSLSFNSRFVPGTAIWKNYSGKTGVVGY